MPPIEVISAPEMVNYARSVTLEVKSSIPDVALRNILTRMPKAPVYWLAQVKAHEVKLLVNPMLLQGLYQKRSATENSTKSRIDLVVTWTEGNFGKGL